MLISNARRWIAVVLAKFDLRIERLSRHPTKNLLGLSDLSFETIIDVGANNGQFASIMLERFPMAHVHSFEPLPAAFVQLSSLAQNSEGRLTVYNFALGAEDGILEMFQHDFHTSSSSLLPTTEDCVEHFPQTIEQSRRPVPVRKLDDVFAAALDQGLGRTLVKLDVQGYEAAVISGGKNILLMADAVIVEICLIKLYVGGPSFEEISDLLCGAGYVFSGVIEQTMNASGEVIFMDALFRKKGAKA